MHSLSSSVLAAVLLLVADDSNADLAKADAKELQGNWTMVGLEIDGKMIEQARFKDTTLEVRRDKYIVKTGRKAREVRFKLDASKKPKEIDLFFPNPPNAEQLHRGIYLIDGDTFKMCKAQAADQPRPTELRTRPDTGVFVVTWHRRAAE